MEEELLGATQEIIVENPLFAVTREWIVQRTPLPDSQGTYTDVLPHVVLKGGRSLALAGCALLLFKEEEAANMVRKTTVAEYLTPKPGLLLPSIACLTKEKNALLCTCIRLTLDLFHRIAPRAEELPFLTHYRQVYIGDKPEMNLDPEGMFTVILANRMPEYIEGVRGDYQVHLVSLQGLLEHLDDTAEKSPAYSFVELISLDSWRFTVSGRKPDSFRKICGRLQGQNNNDWLYRLPLPEVLQEESKGQEPTASFKMRLLDGYVPLLYHTRMGDEGLCWSRSPFTPVRTKLLEKEIAFESADAALCYHSQDGVFDVSLATAFEAGRMAALQDEAYLDALFLLQQEAQKQLDTLHIRNLWDMEGEPLDHRLSRFFSETDMHALGQAISLTASDSCWQIETPVNIPEESKQAIEACIKDKGETVYKALKAFSTPVAQWLAKLLLLYPISTAHLIPHRDLLPPESVRFFFVDQNWQRALYDGAVSIGLYASRQSLFNQVIRNLLYEASQKALYEYRAGLYGFPPPQVRQEVLSGFLVRGEITALWPSLSVTAKDKEGQMLAILRMQHLPPDMLLVIFDGIPATIIVNEPEEGLALTLDPQEYPAFREGSGGVLRLEPSSAQGLVALVAQKQGLSKEKIGPAALARCFLTTGERVIFGEVQA